MVGAKTLANVLHSYHKEIFMNKPILDYLLQHNITKKKLAEQCEVSIDILNRAIHNIGKVKSDKLIVISKTINVTVDELLGICKNSQK